MGNILVEVRDGKLYRTGIDRSEIRPKADSIITSDERRFVSQSQIDEWNAMRIDTGPKSSSIDEGYYGQISLTDDYLYLCVVAGTAGNATWKKIAMFNCP